MEIRKIGLAPGKLRGSGGISLAADIGGNPDNPAVIFMHGGGQTRASWGDAANTLVHSGYYVISLDLRGHGDSGWAAAGGGYALDDFIGDLLEVTATLPELPTLVGASLGGVTALAAIGESRTQVANALVLVDVVPRIDPEGAAHIGRFMSSNKTGFSTVEEAADAVSAYLPHRPRPKDVSGLQKNLRTGADGRLYWHWDPNFLDRANDKPLADYERLMAAARNVRVPTLLVRGSSSEIVTNEAAREFLDCLPTAEFVEIAGARHMVAGDKNNAFNTAVFDFLDRRVHGMVSSRSA
jgi:pimeloyl-ACP methyl ester carboxylesterase